MSDGGKGSKARPFSVDRKTFESNWDRVFKNEYQDQLSTEECVEEALEKYSDERNQQSNN